MSARTSEGMILGNGHIRVIAEHGGGIDGNGDPIPVTEELGRPIPCNYQRNSYQGRVAEHGGTHSTASYTVIIDMMEFGPCRFRLYDRTGACLGTYEVTARGIEPLEYVGNIRITV